MRILALPPKVRTLHPQVTCKKSAGIGKCSTEKLLHSKIYHRTKNEYTKSCKIAKQAFDKAEFKALFTKRLAAAVRAS